MTETTSDRPSESTTRPRASSVHKGTVEDIVHNIVANESSIDAQKSLRYTELEHSYGFWQAAKLYYPAVLWCIFVDISVICCGVDGAVVGSVVGLDTFTKQFGRYVAGSGYVIPAAWLGAFNYSNLLGSIFGSLFAGQAYNYLGPRRLLAICSLASIGSIFFDFFAKTPAILFVGELLNGIMIGFYPVIASAYIGEVSPLALRGVSGSLVNLSYVIGQFISSGVLKGTNTIPTQWSYRIPFAIEWIWPVIIFCGCFWCPDPPYWLLRKGRVSEAEKSLRRLATPAVDISLNMANVRETLLLEDRMKESEGKSSFMEVFRGPNLRRLIISSMVFNIQAFVGNIFFINYAVYFFELAGLDSSDSFSMNMGLTAMGFLGTCLSWPLMSYCGRRTLELWGCVALNVLMLIIGLVDLAPRNSSGPAWAQSGLMLFANFIYDVTVGPICFVYLCEISSAKLRSVTIAIANVTVCIFSIIFAVAIPYAINVDEANWRGKLGFLFAGIGALCSVWCYFCLPESKGRTVEELDIMFEQKVGSRQFSKYHIVGAVEVGDA
ncbi:hypothetical protein M8818_006286 [Zalaria obscura]|uniref:Uncharacterized protein n=1 Tax=Zalaria obscura TaxID=2024903 RepID=A0ACC3S986_9PEZI